jgi:homogentisate 1,2-dioxygenase
MEIPGTLEIDHERGVIYFHTADDKALEVYQTTTVMRICGLGKMPVGRIEITLRPRNQLPNTDVAAIVSYDS